MNANARTVYQKCSAPEAANKDQCDQYLIGACPYWRVYATGGYVYNSMEDGLPGCECKGADLEPGSAKPQCRKSAEYGPASGYLHKSVCSTCGEYLAYNGRNMRMPNTLANHGCDGAKSTYDELCDIWYEWVHCKDLEDGKGLNSRGLTSPQTEPSLDAMLAQEITEVRCAMSQRVAAMKMYLKSPQCLIDYPPPAGDCVTPASTATPTPLPT